MLLIPCPFCGDRDETEFAYGGEAGNERPADPGAATDEAWTDYLCFHDNPKGLHRELWFHRDGCRRWLTVERNTWTHELRSARLSRP